MQQLEGKIGRTWNRLCCCRCWREMREKRCAGFDPLLPVSLPRLSPHSLLYPVSHPLDSHNPMTQPVVAALNLIPFSCCSCCCCTSAIIIIMRMADGDLPDDGLLASCADAVPPPLDDDDDAVVPVLPPLPSSLHSFFSPFSSLLSLSLSFALLFHIMTSESGVTASNSHQGKERRLSCARKRDDEPDESASQALFHP